MSTYRNIVFAVDFSEQAVEVGQRAKLIAQLCGARLSLIHVIEEMTITAGYELMPLLPEMPDEDRVKAATTTLADVAKKLGLQDAEQQVITAISTKEGILQAAEKHAADLIVVGSHRRHGLALLLGSTANSVLHGAPCDVLAVCIHEVP